MYIDDIQSILYIIGVYTYGDDKIKYPNIIVTLLVRVPCKKKKRKYQQKEEGSNENKKLLFC